MVQINALMVQNLLITANCERHASKNRTNKNLKNSVVNGHVEPYLGNVYWAGTYPESVN
jgi:hypothetical protein